MSVADADKETSLTDSTLFDPTTDLQLPKSWSLLRKADDGAAYGSGDGLKVIMSGAVELDSKEWIHLSVSRRNRLPSWRDLVLVKTLFIGAERTAYQVLPDHRRHVNIHPFCLHLWAPQNSGEDPLPDFTRGGNSI